MLRLGSPAVVAKTKTIPVNPSYPDPTCCGGGLLQVRVVGLAGTARFDVGTMKLGAPHAILDYQAPQPSLTS